MPEPTTFPDAVINPLRHSSLAAVEHVARFFAGRLQRLQLPPAAIERASSLVRVVPEPTQAETIQQPSDRNSRSVQSLAMLPDITVTLEGAAAVGKTCLAAKLARLLEGEGHIVTVGEKGLRHDYRPDPAAGERFTEPRRIRIVA